MREIRFRAWHKINKNMEYDIEGACDSNDTYFPCFCDYLESVDHEVMQAIGLKDKNGNGIYEGDILELQGINNLDRGVVTWSSAGFVAINQLSKTNLLDYVVSVINIVGNIYENPEIL